MHTFSSPVKEDVSLFSSPVKEDVITSLTRSVFPREVSFPTKVPFLQQNLVSPVELLRCLFPQRSYSKTFVFPSGASKKFVFPSGSLVTPQCCHALLSSHAFINIALHLRIKSCVLYI